MSAEHDSQWAAVAEASSPGNSHGSGSRTGDDDSTADNGRADASKRVRTATVDRGGSPLENPSDIQRAIAARDRLWNTYCGGDVDGCFVWTAPDSDRARREGSERS